MTDRIADEVGDNLLDPLRIDDDHRMRGHVDLCGDLVTGSGDVVFTLLYQVGHDLGGVVFVKLVFHGLRRHIGDLCQV